MKQLITMVTVMITFHCSYGQFESFERPDYDAIGQDIRKKNSGFYYQDLFDRYLRGDTMLNLEEKRHIYYGYSFQDKYSPYGLSLYSDSVRVYLQKDSLTDDDCREVIRLSGLLLEENPFDLRALNYLAYCYHRLNDPAHESLYGSRIMFVFDAIMSSGDGLSEETAFYVIYVSHEYDLVSALDFQFGGQQMLTKQGYDYLSLEPNRFGIDGFYFDVSRCLASLDRIMK